MTTLAAPSVGRFLSSDPAQAGSNWYAYCDNNPLVRVDPTGLDGNETSRGAGPSGKAKIHNVPHKRKKDAYEDAKHEGNGREPIHHPNQGSKGGHYHPRGQDGDVKKNGVHHTYPIIRDVGKGTVVGVIGVGIWEVGKWGIGIITAPETGGMSLVAVGALP